jgi:DNA replication protein DnaC
MEHQMLLEAYLKRLKLPAMLTHYQEMARQAEQGNQTFEGYLLALSELETQQRDENAFKRRVSHARFPLAKTLDQFDFSAIPSLSKAKVLNLAQGEYIRKKENLLLMGNSGTGKTHLATALGLTACQQGKNVRFLTAAGLINQLTEAQAGLRLSHIQRVLAKLDLLIIDEIGYVPFSERGAELFFQVVADSYVQATLGATDPPHYKQYLRYDKDNRYTGVLSARLGGRPLTKDRPYGELGGSLDLYDVGNIPITPPSYQLQIDPLKRFPEGVEVTPIEPPYGR